MKVIKYETPKREEQESILRYDQVDKDWHIYTDVLKHVHIFEEKMDKNKYLRIGKNSQGKTTMLDGVLDKRHFYISVRKHPNLSQEAREALAKRLNHGQGY